jgi:iron(III) transport system permease protein
MTGIIFVISCYTFPFVFVLVANALDNMPGELEDASAILGGKGLDHGAAGDDPLALPALVAGRVDRVSAGDDPVRLAGDPGAARRLPHHDHENLEPVPVSAKARTRRRRRGAAIAADHRAAAGAKIHPRPPRLFGGRRQVWRAAPGRDEEWRWAALAFCLVVLLNPVFLPYFALFNAGVLAERDDAGDALDVDAAQHRVRVHRIVVDADWR